MACTRTRTLIAHRAEPYRVITWITSPDGDTRTAHAKDFVWFHEALAHYEEQTCSLRVVGHELIRRSDATILERKGWIYGHASGDFDFKRAVPRIAGRV